MTQDSLLWARSTQRGRKPSRSSLDPRQLTSLGEEEQGMVVPFYRRTSEKQQLSKNHTSMSETKIELGWKGKTPAEPRFTSLPPPPSAPCCS